MVASMAVVMAVAMAALKDPSKAAHLALTKVA
jgi:hypothetical protein